MTLQRSMSLASAVLVFFALLVCATLLWTSTELRLINEATVRSFESVRSAEKARGHLALLADETDPTARSQLTRSLRLELGDLAGERNIGAFLAGDASARSAAEATLDAAIARDLASARASLKRTRFWDTVSDALGITSATLSVVLVLGTLVWLQRRAIRPIFAVGEAMSRFGSGDRAARAREQGPTEIREMAVRFNEMADALGSQRQAQMTFLAGVAHDLRNPISVLKMASALAASPDVPFETLSVTMKRVQRQVDRLDRMVGDLLDVTRIEAGNLDMKFREEDVTALTRQAVELFEGASAGHDIVVRAPERPLVVACDRVRVEQVVTNLVSNAIKYSPPETTVEVSLEERANEAVLSVQDHGAGISESDQGRLFEPFRRLGRRDDAVKGTGLGLFVVKRIVEAHCGRIEVTSEPGRGSTFRVFLPERPQASR